jgi:hypothetical protein
MGGPVFAFAGVLVANNNAVVASLNNSNANSALGGSDRSHAEMAVEYTTAFGSIPCSSYSLYSDIIVFIPSQI